MYRDLSPITMSAFPPPGTCRRASSFARWSERMFDEDELLPLSGLQHLVFCERQWALIHIEQIWAENRLTAEGRELHDRAHEAGSESRPGLRIARGLRLRSLRLGITGQADVVEFRAAGIGATGRHNAWGERVNVALVELEADYGEHVELTEGSEGLYRALLATAPPS